MVFYRVLGLVCFVLFVSVAEGAPTASTTSTTSPSPDVSDCEDDDVIDQRQNGTENYRFHVNGIVVLVAPAETILQAAQIPGLDTEAEDTSETASLVHKPKPKPKPQSANEKVPVQGILHEEAYASPQDNKEKNNMKILNLLDMFRSMKHNGRAKHT